MLVTRTMKPSVLLLLLSVLLDWTRITLAEEENTESSAQAQASSVEILQQQEQQGLRGARRSHCPSTEQRVCCLDGMEYPNMCTAAHLHDVNPADCARTHFYNPVCCESSSDNHDKAEYFNACQAAAAGRIDCVAGSCPKPCAAAAANGDPPVCCHGTDNYPNLCQAALVLPQVVVETACVPGICPPPTPLPCPADGTVPAKVCCDAGRREFASRCHAAQSGFGGNDDDCVVGKCPNEPEPLNCPTDYQPVCCHQPRNGFHGFSNLCEAAKEGVDVRDCRMGECPPLTSSSSP